MKYAIILEPTDTGFSAYCPDLPGCVSTGATREEVETNMRESILFHLEGMRAEGLEVPTPTSDVGYVQLTT